MSGGWTQMEIEAELKRRRDAQEAIERRRLETQRRNEEQRSDGNCIHCGRPFPSWMSRGGEYGICDDCIGD